MKGICSVLGEEFEILDKEKKILEQISFQFGNNCFQIPLPNISPNERMRIRTSHRNEQNLYKNRSDIDGNSLISIYSSDLKCKIFTQSYWFSDDWDPLDYGRDFDFSRSFFEQFYELSLDVPKANMVTMNNENCEYTTGTGYCKNCYLINSSEYCEDCYYGKLIQSSKNIVDSSYVYDSEICYQCFNVRNCYECFYVYNSQNSNNCYYSDNLTGCKNCFLCTNLNNKEYYFKNEKYSKEDYLKLINKYKGNFGMNNALNDMKILIKARIFKYANIINSENCTGDYIRGSKNSFNCYDITDCEDCGNLQVGLGCKDVYDCSNMYVNPELSYQVLGVIETFNVHFSLYIFTSSDILYSEHLYSCKNCFGCSGLRNKEYCIFNKQYSKEEYEYVVSNIIIHMQKTGEWGKFFPSKYSMFCYNESLANDYLPLDKNEVFDRELKWKSDIDELKVSDTSINGEFLPNTIDDVDESILNKVILCEDSKRPYKILEQELKFYKCYNLPVPRKHPDVRHKERMSIRNPRKLWNRKCVKCEKDVKTTYSPEKPEIIYCETCYLQHVY